MNNKIQHKNYVLVVEIMKLNTVGLTILNCLYGGKKSMHLKVLKKLKGEKY